MGLNKRLKELVETTGVDFYGVADLTPAHDAILAQGGTVTASFPRAVSLGIALNHAIVNQLPRRAERAVSVSYRHHCYDVVNNRLDLIVSQVSSWLQREGYEVLPIPASKRVDDEHICAVFSHKMAAHLAGLGWIGKSCLLVTRKAGPRVRWATVLTDAPVKITGGPMAERCGNCNQCVEICPVGAFTGRPFRVDEPREARYDARKCEKYLNDLEQKDIPGVCGLCLYVCPYGKKRGGG